MDSFEFNKLAGGLLGTLLFVVAVGLIGDFIYVRGEPTKAGYELPATVAAAAAPTGPAAPTESLPQLLAASDATRGQTDATVCTACHNLEKGAGPKIGPPLYGVVGRPVASVAGFDYSEAMKGKGGTWTYDDLFQFLSDPRGVVKGTKMTFAGEPSPTRRADILAYLRTLSDAPVPFPQVAQASPAPAAAPAANAPAGGAPAATAPATTPAAPASSAPAAPAPVTTPAAPAASAPTTPAPAAQAPDATAPATTPAPAETPAQPATPPAAPADQPK